MRLTISMQIYEKILFLKLAYYILINIKQKTLRQKTSLVIEVVTTLKETAHFSTVTSLNRHASNKKSQNI